MSQPAPRGRRDVLCGVAAAGALVLAGCSGGGDGSTPATTTQPTTATPTPEAEAAVEEDLELAAADFSRAGDVFRDRVDRLPETFDFVDLEPGPMADDVAVGMETLDAVEGGSDDPPPALPALRSVGEWLALLLDALEAYADGLDRLQTGAVYVRNDRYDEAVAELEPTAEHFRSVGTHLEDAAARQAEVDVEPLAEFDDGGPEAVRDRLETIRGSADDLGAYAAAMAHYVEGLVDHSNGRKRYAAGDALADEERYGDAAGVLETAAAHFAAAREDALAGEAVAPTPLLEAVVRLTCSAGHYRAAAEHFLTAVEEADRGDTADAEAAYDEALAEEDAANAC